MTAVFFRQNAFLLRQKQKKKRRENIMNQTKTRTLTECALLLALGIGLSFIGIIQMPAGGTVTLASMLPLLLVGVKYAPKWAFGTSFAYALFQLIQAIMKGHVFPYCETWYIVILCALLDYLLPYIILGVTAFSRKKTAHIYLYTAFAILFRFLCHFLSGILIWGQWAVNMPPALYSLVYNGTFLLPELGITLAVMIPLLEVKAIRRLLRLPIDK